jgi:hypothetical protein
LPVVTAKEWENFREFETPHWLPTVYFVKD